MVGIETNPITIKICPQFRNLVQDKLTRH